MEAYLILADGTTYRGSAIGAVKEVISEVVFNTSMTGYQEVLTDPSYAGQAVTMTYPLIGNYGICRADMESSRAWPDAFLVRELTHVPGNWRAENTIQNFLKQQEIPGIAGLDTRALTRHLRSSGTMNGCITTKWYAGTEKEKLLEKIRSYSVRGVVKKTTASGILHPEPESSEADAGGSATDPGGSATDAGGSAVRTFPADSPAARRAEKYRVALLDVGAKRSIQRALMKLGCEVTVYPSDTAPERILADRPDGILISNGPGDPKEDPALIRNVRVLGDSGVPVFAICLGHQLMALAMGADTFRLKYGHRGGNHPVKDLQTGRVYITSQNHGYAVDPDSMDPAVAREAFRNVNDGTNEGWVYLDRPVMTVQFHPEASPGPRDSGNLFRKFIEMMEEYHA
ncbi:MAG: carbamoyl phosphate synthase small subunit [Eubacterium sp.]|nr:carbamoyl phosphate synthase small subunit [Eubacterium sp.]